VIAHRLSTARRADRIVVLDDGAIVEEGTHDQLIARRGAYFDLWRRHGAEAPAAVAEDR
jgi:ATP-binding cassette subfamily B protein